MERFLLVILSIFFLSAACHATECETRSCSLSCGESRPSKMVTNMKSKLDSLSPDCPQTKYVFPRANQVTDYVRLKSPLPPMSEGTICMWVKGYGTGVLKGALVSYSTQKSHNTLMFMYDQDRIALYTLGGHKSFHNSLKKGDEHHICLVFSRIRGKTEIYYNGTKSIEDTFPKGDPIPSGGAFLIGQEQDSHMGSLEADQAFHGEIRNYMMWDRILSTSEIRGMFANECNCAKGFIASFTPEQVQLEGAANTLNVDQCV